MSLSEQNRALYPKLSDFLLGLTLPGGTMHILRDRCGELAGEINALMEQASRPGLADALAALEPFAQHAMDIADAVDLTSGGQVEMFIDVADLLGAVRVHARLADADPWQEGAAERDGGDGAPVRSLSVQATDKSDRAEGVAALQQAAKRVSKSDAERLHYAGVRASIAWLHDHAETMNDPHAKAVINTAAFGLGVNKPSPLPQQTALVEEGVGIAAFLIEQDDEPLAADLGARMNYWRDKCITAGQRLDPKRWGPK